MKISISICPTNLECSSDVMSEPKYLARIREVVEAEYPDATITWLQVGFRQGDEWFKIDGEKSVELYELISGIDCSDEELYDEKPESDDDETKCECGGTLHHSDDMDDANSGSSDKTPFYQCEECGAIKSDSLVEAE